MAFLVWLVPFIFTLALVKSVLRLLGINRYRPAMDLVDVIGLVLLVLAGLLIYAQLVLASAWYFEAWPFSSH